MTNHIKYQWRITKYNPDYRDKDGFFTLKEEWTCPSEIGKIIDGKEFTLREYIQFETAYINTLISILRESGLSKLKVLQLNKLDISIEQKSSVLYEDEFAHVDLEEDKELTIKEIRVISKMILRNFLGCQLYSKDKFFVHFGWDYYMYVGSRMNCLKSLKLASAEGLFMEEITSPYYVAEDEIIRNLEWYEDIYLVGEEELTGISLDEYQRLFNLSDEHPITGLLEISIKQSDFIQKFVNHKMDFSKFTYRLFGGT